MANVLQLQYTDMDAALAALIAWGGAGTVGVSVPNSASLIPGTCIAWGRDTLVVVISGTSNHLQAATQVQDVLNGMIPTAYYSTLQLWEVAAQAILTRIATTADVTQRRVLLVGHSYGGAVASLVAARFAIHRPEVPLQLLTMGGPKPGDSRLAAILLRLKTLGLVVDGDPVPYCPPIASDLPDIFRLLLLVDPPTYSAMFRRLELFARPPNQLRILADGSLVSLVMQPTGQEVFQRLIAELFQGSALTGIAAHAASEYFARLSL